MHKKVTALIVLLLIPMIVGAQNRSAYTWVDDDGVRHYGDKIPAEYADKEKSVINEHGVVIDTIEGKKSAEQLEAQRVADELEMQKELQKRADRALLATYQNVNEIEMHRDRRVELFQAQSRVTELYLRNLDRRLQQLKKESMSYRPYNSDPSAPMVEPKLMREIEETESTIARHQKNLEKYQADEADIIQRFNGDIYRFKNLKGLSVTAQALPE
jgi:hypothetical protein